MATTRVIKIDGEADVAAAARQAAAALKAGQLVGFPTETVYGIAALATCQAAMARLRELKSRPRLPFSVHLGRPRDAARYVQRMPAPAQRIISKAWPGPITLVVPTGRGLADPELDKAGLQEVLCKDGQVGLRCPDAPVALAMLSAVDGPVVAPSANLAGAPSPRSARQVLQALDGRIDLLLDAGPTRYGMDSTIVRCDEHGWKVLRQGVYDEKMVRRLMRRTYLFVCTGNTCRSPIAAGLARKLLAARAGCSVSELPRHGIEVLSAGTAAMDGQRASPEAIRAARRHGANIARHSSQKLTALLINSADLIFCMSDLHIDAVRRMVPAGERKVLRLDPDGNVSDPIGGGAEIYARTAEQISKALEIRLAKGVP